MTNGLKRSYALPFLISAIVCSAFMTSCKSDETYAEQKKQEKAAIENFITSNMCIMSDGDTAAYVGIIVPISEAQFNAQGQVTDLLTNQYVLFENTGVYMQIIRKGTGSKLLSGQSKRIIARYLEFNILLNTIQTRNDILYFSTTPDILDVTNTYGTFTASFNTDNGGGAMYRFYSSTEVPAGWLVPFSYINIGRQIKETDEISKVRLIVPHSQGTAYARQSVYPCFYEITYQEMRD